MKYTAPTFVAYKKMFFCFFLLLFVATFAVAQQVKHRIAVFAPVYIDSAFDGKTYKLWGNYLPKNMLPGLEFYNGMMMALDSLKIEGISNLIIDFYDYRSKGHSLNRIVEDSTNKLEESKLIIASFNNRSDINPLPIMQRKTTYRSYLLLILMMVVFPIILISFSSIQLCVITVKLFITTCKNWLTHRI